ncbi:hypothetical protein N7449_003139 [Penicillium cf. viridicatum]|uniref:Enoyl reductase (ER) domain-containing protein n=1 Tax=Penicillium cf. viridicatum TaxID=2972119 RepID=A0A9W9T4Z1_9EURO|nr:hypothetical protein N7449_003139 [Penicillium cf. viridicatum]
MPGLLDTLHFVPDQSFMRAPLADDKVEILVKATGINFRDIMASMGLVPVRGLGQEASAGGIGQAAVQLAKHLSLVTYVTVGTDDKRRFMSEHFGIASEHIFSSRDSSFVKGIQRQKKGPRQAADCPPQICTGLGTADILAAHSLPNPLWFNDTRFGPLTVLTSHSSRDSDSGASPSLASKLSQAGNNKDLVAAGKIITSALAQKMAETLRIPPSEVDPRGQEGHV